MTKISDLITSGDVEVAKRAPKKRKDAAEPSTGPSKKTTTATQKSTAAMSSREPAVMIVGEGSHISATPGKSKASAIPVGIPIRGVTIANPPRGQGVTVIPEKPVTGSSLFNLHHVPSKEAGDDKRHPGAHWCPEWDINVNDRCKNPLVAHELLVHSVLPRDNTYARKLTPAELMQSASVSWASTSAFFAEMLQRYGHLMQTYEPPAELQKRITDLEEKLRATELERDKAEKGRKKAKIANNSLITALDEEKERKAQEEQSNKEAMDKAGVTAVEAFRKSESFTRDLGELTRPSFMLGYTSAVNDAMPFISSEQLESLQSASHYNEDAKELCDRMAAGIQAGRDLAEVRAEFNKWL